MIILLRGTGSSSRFSTGAASSSNWVWWLREDAKDFQAGWTCNRWPMSIWVLMLSHWSDGLGMFTHPCRKRCNINGWRQHAWGVVKVVDFDIPKLRGHFGQQIWVVTGCMGFKRGHALHIITIQFKLYRKVSIRLTDAHVWSGKWVRPGKSSQLDGAGLIKFNVFPNITVLERGKFMIVVPLSTINVQDFLHLRNNRSCILWNKVLND